MFVLLTVIVITLILCPTSSTDDSPTNFFYSTISEIELAVTVVCHVIPASGRLVDVDILELSEFFAICQTSMGVGWRMVKELT